MIFNFQNFLLEFAKRDFNTTLYFSPEFKRILKSIDSTLSRTVLDKEGNQIKQLNYTYIGVTKVADKVSFVPESKLTVTDDPWNKGRSQVGIGKVFKAICPEFTPHEVEQLVNAYKAKFSILKKGAFENFKIVEGKDIRKYYSEDRYESGNGTLNKSCMRYDSCQSYLEIYVDNPEVCKLLILMDDNDNKIRGRALLWDLNKPEGKRFMDRVYTINDSDVNLFVDFAKHNDWLFKRYQDSGNYDIYDNDGNEYKGLRVKIKRSSYENYPYVDTLQYFDGAYLRNVQHGDSIELRDTDGGYEGGEEERLRERLNDMRLSDIADEYGDDYIWNHIDDFTYISDMMSRKIDDMTFDDISRRDLIDWLTNKKTADDLKDDPIIEAYLNEDEKEELNDDNYEEVINRIGKNDLEKIVDVLGETDFFTYYVDNEYSGRDAKDWFEDYEDFSMLKDYIDFDSMVDEIVRDNI